MQNNRHIPITWYAVIDFFMAILAWVIFYFLRKKLLNEPLIEDSQLLIGKTFWLGIIIIPTAWLILYALTGTYHSLYKKSRLTELTNTFVISLVGSIVLFFILILNDTRNNYSYFFMAFITLLSANFILTFTGRLLLLNTIKKQILKGSVFFNTMMIGSRDNAIRIFKETQKSQLDGGYRYIGFITPDENGKNGILKFIPKLGTIDELEKIIDENNIHQVVLAMERSEQVDGKSVV